MWFLQTMTSKLITGIFSIKKSSRILFMYFCRNTSFLQQIYGNNDDNGVDLCLYKPGQLTSTTSLALPGHLHCISSHLPFMIMAISDRSYPFVASVILSLHLSFTMSRGACLFVYFLFFKEKTPHSWTFYHWFYTFVCILLVTFSSLVSNKTVSLFLSKSNLQVCSQDCISLNFFKKIPSLITF